MSGWRTSTWPDESASARAAEAAACTRGASVPWQIPSSEGPAPDQHTASAPPAAIAASSLGAAGKSGLR